MYRTPWGRVLAQYIGPRFLDRVKQSGADHDGQRVPGQQVELELDELTALLFEHIERQSALADSKAQLLVAGETVALAALLPTMKGVGLVLFDPRAAIVARVSSALLMLMLVVLLASLLLAIISVRPRLWTVKLAKPSLTYFAHIANLTESDFVKAYTGQTPSEIREHMVAQLYGKSRVAVLKYRAVKRSVNCLLVAVVLWAASGAFSAFIR